jgi:hypothetical protein
MNDELKRTWKEAVMASRYHPRICLEGLTKSTNPSMRIGGVRPRFEPRTS